MLNCSRNKKISHWRDSREVDQILHHNKFLQIYQINHLDLTMNYAVRVANIDFYLFFYIEIFNRSPLKLQYFSSSTQFILTHKRNFIYILINYKLKKKVN